MAYRNIKPFTFYLLVVFIKYTPFNLLWTPLVLIRIDRPLPVFVEFHFPHKVKKKTIQLSCRRVPSLETYTFTHTSVMGSSFLAPYAELICSRECLGLRHCGPITLIKGTKVRKNNSKSGAF